VQVKQIATYAAALAVLSLLGTVGATGAGADPIDSKAIKVSGNSFSSASQMKQLVRVHRNGNPACSRSFSSSQRMKVVMGGMVDGVKTELCAYDPMVLGGTFDGGDDAGTPSSQEVDNLEIYTVGRLSSGSPPARVDRAFLAVEIRDGDNGDIAHHLAVFPATQHWEVWRRGPSQSQCSIIAAGDGAPVAGLSQNNELSLRVFRGVGGGSTEIKAVVNESVVHSSSADPGFSINPERTAVALGVSTPVPGQGDRTNAACANTNDGGGKDVSGSFDDTRVYTTDLIDPSKPATVGGDLIKLGNTPGQPSASCPASPCEVVGRVTGFQKRISPGPSGPYNVPQGGQMVAFRVKLSEPTSSQQAFFDDFAGGGPRAGVGVINKVEPYSNRFTLTRKFPGVDMDGFLGRRLTIAPGSWLRVDAGGDKAALIVPTWLPAFRTALSGSNTWRGTREEGFFPPDSGDAGSKPECLGAENMENGHAHTVKLSTARYVCNYDTARLLYTSMIAPDSG